MVCLGDLRVNTLYKGDKDDDDDYDNNNNNNVSNTFISTCTGNTTFLPVHIHCIAHDCSLCMLSDMIIKTEHNFQNHLIIRIQ